MVPDHLPSREFGTAFLESRRVEVDMARPSSTIESTRTYLLGQREVDLQQMTGRRCNAMPGRNQVVPQPLLLQSQHNLPTLLWNFDAYYGNALRGKRLYSSRSFRRSTSFS